MKMQRIQFFKYIIRRSITSQTGNEYTITPEYPPILDLSPKEIRKRELAKKYEKFDKLNTVEEKLFAINLDKYYGWNSIMLSEHNYPYRFLPFVKFITRTYLEQAENKEIFHKVQNVDFNECKMLAENMRDHLKESLLFALKGKKTDYDDNLSTQNKCNVANVIETINATILSFISNQHPHLLDVMIDYQPRLEAFWMVGSFHPSAQLYELRKKEKKLNDEQLNEPVDHWIQYFGKPMIQLRMPLPLTQLETQYLKQYNDNDRQLSVPIENSDPQIAYGLKFERRHGTNIPGYWPGDANEFGLISYHNQNHLLDRPPHFGDKERHDTLLAQAILSSFAWLHGQACYQGFSTFTDLTYPLVNQNIITDGRQFTFSLYQLNTTLLHGEHSINNARVNLCLTTPSLMLYQEISENTILGWNDEVIATLLTFYLNKPQVKEGINLKPFLNFKEKYLSDIEDAERRIWYHNQFRHMYSNRPRHMLPYEIYDWERIYKVKFPTRPMDARMRPFEHDCNPLEDRKYNEFKPAYIPKKFRPKKKHWAGWRAKLAKTYFPEI